MLFSIFLSFVISEDVNRTISCKLNADGQVAVVDGFVNDADAWALFTDSYSSIGWGQVHIWTNSQSPSYNQMYCAGFADAYVTRDRIQEAFLLFKEAQIGSMHGSWNQTWVAWFSQNINYMRKKTANPVDDYWRRTALILAQFDGMVDGYKNASKADDLEISELDFWILQSGGDLDDLTTVFNNNVPVRDPELTLKCTGLIKIEPGFGDIYFAQDTWSDYRDLHAYLKEYNLNVPEFKSHRVTISTRTGHMASVDDFWTNDKGLLVLETTMHCFNNTLYSLYVKPESVLTWIRSYHTMFATDNGKEWTEHFIRENSGTYNNEYIVLDSKKFEKGVEPKEDLLWIIEQFPGNYMSKDITKELVEQTYFPSVNTPWFKELFELANYPGIKKEDEVKAPFWDYYEQPRSKIIFRDAPNITDYEKFKKFMRYNDYKHDPILNITYNATETHNKTENWLEPAQGILSRYDLRPEEGTPYGAKNHFGGLDAKTARLSVFMENHSWDAINSPEYFYNDPFNFADWSDISHLGLAEEWKYPWMEFRALDYCQIYGDNKDKCMNIPGCGFCIYCQECMMGDKEGPSNSLNQKCEDGWSTKQENPSYTVPLVVSVTVLVVIFVGSIYALHFYKSKKQSTPQYQNI